MPKYTNQPYDYGEDVIAPSLTQRQDLLEANQNFIYTLIKIQKACLSQLSWLLSEEKCHKYFQEFFQLIHFTKHFSVDDSKEKIISDIERLEQLPILLSGFVYAKRNDLTFDRMESGVDKKSDVLWQQLNSNRLNPYLTADKNNAILAYESALAHSQGCDGQTTLENRFQAKQKHAEDVSHLSFNQAKRERPMSDVRIEAIQKQRDFIISVGELKEDYIKAMNDIFEKQPNHLGKPKSPTPAHRHMALIEDLQAHLKFIDDFHPHDSLIKKEADAIRLNELDDVITGHALVIAKNLDEVSKKTGATLENNALYQMLKSTFKVNTFSSDKKAHLKQVYYRNMLFQMDYQQQDSEIKDRHIKANLENLKKTTAKVANKKYALSLLGNIRTLRRELYKINSHNTRMAILDEMMPFIEAMLQVRPTYESNHFIYHNAIENDDDFVENTNIRATQKYNSALLAAKKKMVTNPEHLAALDVFESLLNFIEDFNETDSNMKIEFDIDRLVNLQYLAMGAALLIQEKYPTLPMTIAFDTQLQFNQISFEDKVYCVEAFRAYLQQNAEIMPEANDLGESVVASTRMNFEKPPKNESLASFKAKSIEQKSALIALRQDKKDESSLRKVLNKVYQLELLYSSKKDEKSKESWFGAATKEEKAKSSWLGASRFMVWQNQQPNRLPKERTQVIEKIQAMTKFLEGFSKTDSNDKIQDDVKRLELLEKAIVGAAVAEFDSIKKSYDEGLSSYSSLTKQQPTNSALYCVLNDVFEISKMSEREKDSYLASYNHYQQKFEVDGVDRVTNISWQIA